MLPVSDIARSAAFYRDLLGLAYRREFSRGGVVTGCALRAPEDRYALALRLRDTTPGKADLRDEHPLIMRVPDGEHPDAAWIEVRDPDGICIRFAVPTRPWDSFVGLRYEDDDTPVVYDKPRLDV